ncbi:MAG: multidrug ABC transporter [Candidatus Marinimicrobia bacterium]|jgi:subfamily B ATP-binding cassette protein MsbA|nr:multidrug ABC transporter [Candidatus Neomarinimicrobiota bacterium]MBL47047.1 multidrug ABC transporter [Candidatus Neomarinimicrobiota bacterium]MEC8702933.1 ABC transporter ATP-binding protein [Candidatus Neomarinimicrobiota bacterium]|tara:strand:+ start:7334 stop:9166 length:1833 start_codon:yes stop_codon:yes gene_type:complete
MQKLVYKRMGQLMMAYWPYIILSSLSAIIFVLLNGLSIWLTATLINNILLDFDSILQSQSEWSAREALTPNEALKYWTNVAILRDTPSESLKVLCLTILGVFFVKNIFLYLKNILLYMVQLNIVKDIRDKLYNHIQKLSLGYFNKEKSGTITSVIINDVEQLQGALSVAFQKLFVEPINILTFATLLFIISWKLALIAIVIIPLAGVAIITIGKSIRRKSRRTQKKIAEIMQILSENLSSIRIVKAFVNEKEEIKKFSRETTNYLSLHLKRARLDLIAAPITESFGVIIGVVLLWYGGSEVILQRGLIAEDFIRFILILFSILGPIKQLSNVNIRIQAGAASAERIFNLLDTEPQIVEINNPTKLQNFKNEVVFKNVNFEYFAGDGPVLDNINFSIKKGEVVALVGPSGSGKSTIADLIPRFYDVNSGSIMFDGEDIKNASLASLRNNLGIVSQEVVLFNDTIRNNIAYAQPNKDESEIRKAAEAANALEFIEKTQDGFDTVVGERGVKLSGGQKQRLAIARALLKNPSILILDEATSALDTESEKKVQKAIESLMKDRTALVIAHRLSTVQNADKIIVIEKGVVVENGSHSELYEKNGLYRRLYDIQFD